MLSDMMTFNQRTQEAADSWAAEREVALTQELDSWLRHHRCGLQGGEMWSPEEGRARRGRGGAEGDSVTYGR